MSTAKKILVVDDEEEIRELLEFFFEMDGYEVVTASSGNLGFQTFKEEQDIDLVVSDIRMADGTGVDLLNNIKKAGDRGIRVVLLTGYADISVEDGLAMGAYRVLPKPIKSEVLLEVVRDALIFEDSA